MNVYHCVKCDDQISDLATMLYGELCTDCYHNNPELSNDYESDEDRSFQSEKSSEEVSPERLQELKTVIFHREKEFIHPNAEVPTFELPCTNFHGEKESFYETMDHLTNELLNVLVAKNKDYGDSVHEQFKKYGTLAYAIRLEDKFRRMEKLIQNASHEVDESLRDTLIDLAGYALLTIRSLDLEKR